MAAPQDAPEQAFRLRKFTGTNTELDSTFLGPSFVSRTENWIPAQNYRLGKRPGQSLVDVADTIDVTDLLVAHVTTDNHVYIYTYGWQASGGDIVQVSVDEGALATSAQVPTFAAVKALGRMVQFRDRVYAGNGVDPLVTWKPGDLPANTLTLGPIADLGAPPGATGTTASGSTAATAIVPSGTYTYTWAHFDTTKGVYTGRFQPGSVNVMDNQFLTFTVPAAAPAGQVNRLFVSPRNFPIEYATMQMDNVPATPTTVTLSLIDVSDTRVPLAGGTLALGNYRTGNMFVIWRNRVIFAGDTRDPVSIFATDVLLPGLEQSAFNLGTLFPAFAKVSLPDTVTGVGIAGVSSDFQLPLAPLLFFTKSRTYIVQGDPFDPAGQAVLTELSSRVGCVGHDTIVNTPLGTIFCGLDSVYLIPPLGGYPQDIGWPIADRIRRIMPSSRARLTATFHKQFYKLAIPAGAGDNTQEWWLDLRQAIIQGELTDLPSWWGPHTVRTRAGSFQSTGPLATDVMSSYEFDRGYAISQKTQLVRTHQISTFVDVDAPSTPPFMPIRSILTTGRFDADDPFITKIFTRLRIICQTSMRSQLQVGFVTDGNTAWSVDPIEIGQGLLPSGKWVPKAGGVPLPPPIPSYNAWNHLTRGSNAQFRTLAPVEVQTITPSSRPRGLSAVVTLTHTPDPHMADSGDIQLRDFELLFIPSQRKVRYLGESLGKP